MQFAILSIIVNIMKRGGDILKNFFGSIFINRDELSEAGINYPIKVEYYKITDENNRKLAGFLWEQTKLVIAKVKPSKFKGHLRFGFDEPDITGRAAMYAAVLYGFLGLDFDIIPDFENEILEGEVYLKGNVQLFGIVVIALRVYTNELFKKIILKKN